MTSQLSASEKIEVYFFKGCPNADRVFSYFDSCGIAYNKIDVETLDISNPNRNFSSPSVLVDNRLVFGSEVSAGATGCTVEVFSPEALARALSKNGNADG